MEDVVGGVDLKRLLALLEETEERHVQQRQSGALHLVGCSCGVVYSGDDRYGESHAHLREVLARTVLEVLSGPCEACRGSGQRRRSGETFECFECAGVGQSLFPLPLLQYRDREGAVWSVVKDLGDGRVRVVRHGEA